MSEQQNQQDKTEMKPAHNPDENMGINVSGHILIRDKESGQVLVNKRNAIHYGNMAYIVAQALNNRSDAFIHYMAFGNGATSVDTSGRIVYKTPRVTEAYESGANLYSRTYWKAISDSDENTDKINKDFRVVLKAHFCVYHKSMYIFGRLLTNLSIHYNKKFRNLFLYTLSPKTFMQKITALNVIFWTKIYHGIEAYIGYNNILYISFMLSITYLFNDIYIFIIGTSYIHYVRYFLTYYYKYNCAYKMFVRDVVLYKLISDINIYMMHFDYLNNREQFIILFWYILSNLHIIKDLGIYKYLLGNILGYIQENQYDTVIRYNIYMYQVLSYVSLQNSEYCKKDHNYLLSTHIGFYILLTIQEFLQI